MFLVLVLFRNPVIFVKAITLALRNLANPRAFPSYITEQWDVYVQAIEYGLHLGTSASRGAWASYSVAHDVARAELYKAGRDYALKGNTGRHTWRAVFGPVMPGERELFALVDVVNKMTGSFMYAGRGFSRSQQQIESVLLVPRYVRCVVGLILDAFSGGVRGNEARVLLMCYFVWGLFLQWLL